VASWDGGRKIVETALDHYGRIDILINNAGILRDQILYKMSEAEWDRVVDVHLMGSFTCTRAAAPIMMKQKWGRILFITSTAGFIGSIAQCNYGAAKMGMLGLSRSLAFETEHHNVTSNCIAPFAWTRIPASIPTVTDEVKESVDRLFKDMGPEDISPLVVFLASDRASAITGQLFGVRGKEIFIFNQPRVARSLHKGEGWKASELAEVLESTFRHHLTPLDNSVTYFDWAALL
jgi:NAD(P)-dependent dehydrogenase (short-subunit alcohol dehydrogenase family)